MEKLNWKALSTALNARKPEERVLLLAVLVLVLGFGWLTFVHDVLTAGRADTARRIAVATSQIAAETAQQAEIERTFTSDPNAFALNRQRELRAASAQVDARLAELYGELISPQQMSQVLSTILQRDTALELVSLENLPADVLISTEVQPDAANAGAQAASVQIFRHGLRMVFEGDYLETLRYLRSLEALDRNFFWEALEFEVLGWPRATITLDIYTLSMQRGWIGV